MKQPSVLSQRRIDNIAHLCTFFLLMGGLLMGTGCVSQRAYDQARAQADDLTRSLQTAREDVTELHQRIAELEAVNKETDAAATEMREALQHEAEMLPVLRQRANERLTSLHAQVSTLVNQSRILARQIADAKQESTSLKVLVSQYKQEIEEAQSYSEPAATRTSMPIPASPAVDQPPPPEAAAPPVAPPQEMAQVTPITPAEPPAPPPPAQTPPAPVEESWFDMVMNWLASLWNWIIGIFG